MSKVILSVEDDDAAYFLMVYAMRHVAPDFALYRVIDGVHALAFLRRGDSYETAPRPDLIFVNLNLPRMSGLEVLAAIREDKSLHTIPAVVISSSELDADRARSLALGARVFMTKPNDYDKFSEMLRAACAYA